MKKKIIRGPLLLLVLFLSLNSCRTEEEILAEEKSVNTLSKFQVFTSTNGEKINYGEGFKVLMEKHDSLNNEQHTSKAMKRAFENAKTVSEEYVEFNIRSQDLISDMGERWIVYPVITNFSVTGLIAGVLNKDETEVEFRRLIAGTEYYDSVFPLFREQYLKSLISARQTNKNGKCGFPMQPPCEIDVIIITPPNSGGGGPWIGGGSGGEIPPKGCRKYENCIHNDPSGGGGGIDPGSKNPCEKVKEQTATEDFKGKIADLAGKTGLKKETGYIQRADGTYTYKDAGGQTDTKNSLDLPRPDLQENKNITGYFHTHVNDVTFINADGIEEIRTGIKMFSPSDVSYFMDMLKNAQEAGRPLSDVYAIMVTSKGNYQIRFNGNQYQIKSFTKSQIEDLTKNFPDFMDKYSKDIELGFLKFIDEKMNVKATSLFKMNNNGTNSEIKLNSDKNKMTTDCPN